MDSDKLITRAEAWKKKSHCLSMDLRLRSFNQAKKFVKEHSIVLWTTKAEAPNLLDAILGRIATGKERQQGKASENCDIWRKQLLMDPEFLECKLFRQHFTAVYQDLWPYIMVFSKLNSESGEHGAGISRDAKRILNYLKKEGPTESDLVKKALKYSSASEARQFLKAKSELQSLLILLARENSGRSTLCLWEHVVPKPIRSAADKITSAEAGAKLLTAALNCSVLVNEKQVPNLFNWANGESSDWARCLLDSRTFVRVPRRNDSWIVPRRILSK
jgi:hypothetical protein